MYCPIYLIWLIECLLCAGCHARHWDTAENKTDTAPAHIELLAREATIRK